MYNKSHAYRKYNRLYLYYESCRFLNTNDTACSLCFQDKIHRNSHQFPSLI